MLDEHAKNVAIRNGHKSEKAFFRYLRLCHWTDEEITEMWKYAQRYKNKEKDDER